MIYAFRISNNNCKVLINNNNFTNKITIINKFIILPAVLLINNKFKR